MLNWGRIRAYSYRASDGRRDLHVKLSVDQDDMRRWLKLHDLLEREYHAPRILEWLEIAGTPYAIEGHAMKLRGESWKGSVMDQSKDVSVLGEGRFLRLVRRDGWEYVERTPPVRAVFIAAVTEENRLLLTSEHRVSMGGSVIGFPAGLVGDIAGGESETIEAGVKRELVEEAGYEPSSVEFLSQGPTSPGITNEVIALALATGLLKGRAWGRRRR